MYMYLQALIKAEAGEGQVQLHAESVREIDRINYMQQGNAALYSDDMLKMRHGLRSHPAVIDAVRRWWRCVRPPAPKCPLWRLLFTRAPHHSLSSMTPLRFLPKQGGTPEPPSSGSSQGMAGRTLDSLPSGYFQGMVGSLTPSPQVPPEAGRGPRWPHAEG